jgi:ssDNA-binding Zn-finger/Zn-ribbon topoisomerase 1
MIRVYCDNCEVETEIKAHERGAHNKCTWCSRDICNNHVYFDVQQRSNCERCAREKTQRVRRAKDPMGSEQYLGGKRGP